MWCVRCVCVIVITYSGWGGSPPYSVTVKIDHIKKQLIILHKPILIFVIKVNFNRTMKLSRSVKKATTL